MNIGAMPQILLQANKNNWDVWAVVFNLFIPFSSDIFETCWTNEGETNEKDVGSNIGQRSKKQMSVKLLLILT